MKNFDIFIAEARMIDAKREIMFHDLKRGIPNIKMHYLTIHHEPDDTRTHKYPTSKGLNIEDKEGVFDKVFNGTHLDEYFDDSMYGNVIGISFPDLPSILGVIDVGNKHSDAAVNIARHGAWMLESKNYNRIIDYITLQKMYKDGLKCDSKKWEYKLEEDSFPNTRLINIIIKNIKKGLNTTDKDDEIIKKYTNLDVKKFRHDNRGAIAGYNFGI